MHGTVPSFSLANMKWIREPSDICSSSEAVITGWTEKGGIAVVANQLGAVAKTLIAARNELTHSAGPDDGYAHPSVFVVNGLLVSATTGLQAVMDSVASLCNHLARDEDFSGDIYFDDFPFRVTSWDYITAIRREHIWALCFQNLSFNEFANKVKHTQPWIGIISQGQPHYMNDIYDSEGVGLLRGILVPIYYQVRSIVSRLGGTYGQPIDLPHV